MVHVAVKGGRLKMCRTLIFLSIVWAGGMMFCPNSPSEDLAPIPWAGKFPVLAIAHRGFSSAAPENTLAAFKKAIEAGSDMIELDVHLSKDGQVVVIHDDTLKRTTSGIGKVSDFSLQELKQLDAGKWFGSRFFGERIPTLKEVLELTRGKIPIHIELKEGDLGRYTITDLADRSLDEVEKAGLVDQVLFGSFSLSAVDRIREKHPRLPVALICNKTWDLPQDATGGRPIPILSSSGKVLNQANASKARQQGMKVFVWTLDKEEHMEQFLNVGVDGIITNHPDKLIKILQKRFK
jgi:glycerophosphoryl diester phosphodiesterase